MFFKAKSWTLPKRRSAHAPPRQRETTELPVLHRLAVAYLMLPVIVWLLGWFSWWLSIPATAALVAGLWYTMAGSWRIALRASTFVLLLVAFGWVMLTAAGNIFDVHNWDWFKHRGVFTDLAQQDWPVRLPDPLAAFLSTEARTAPDTLLHNPSSRTPFIKRAPTAESHAAPDALLRYYLGWYMVPGLVGKWFGTAALHWAVPIWMWGGVALLVLLFTRRFTRIGAQVVAVVVMVCFSGMDYLRILLLSGEALPLLDGSHMEADEHIQYSSNTSVLMWAPQHFIAGGLYTMLLLQLRREPRFLASSGVLLAACLFWSPFVAIGLLPLVAALLLDNGLRPFLRWQNVVLAAPLAALLVIFLSGGTADFVRGWLWTKSDWAELAHWLPVFYLTEFAVLALLLWRCQPQIGRDRFFLASVAALTILPVYAYGHHNDLGMRASLPALMILCWYCAEIVSNSLANPFATRNAALRAEKNDASAISRRPLHAIFACLLATALIVGAITPLHELVRGWDFYKTSQSFQYTNSLLVSTSRTVGEQYALADVPAALGVLLRKHEEHPRVHGEWERVARSEFDIYRNGKLLIYTKAPCSEEELAPPFFLNVQPVDVRDLPNNRQQYGFEHFFYDHLGLYALWLGERCAFVRKLPEYDVRRVTTGQVQEGKHLWLGEFAQPNRS